MDEPEKRRTCFVVGPIGADESEDRTHADWLLDGIIYPVFKASFPDFVVNRADTISSPGQITTQIISALLEADLVIADLTMQNPNAFYEIGIRHMVHKPIIHMFREGESIPFDIAAFRAIKFSTKRPQDLEAARTTLSRFVERAIAEDHEVENPVTFARGKAKLETSATPAEKLMMEEINKISSRVTKLEKGYGPATMVIRNPPFSAKRSKWDVVIYGTSPQAHASLRLFVEDELSKRFDEVTFMPSSTGRYYADDLDIGDAQEIIATVNRTGGGDYVAEFDDNR